MLDPSTYLDTILNNILPNKIKYLDPVADDTLPNELNYFNQQLYNNYNPSISGYTLCLMVPPEFSSLPSGSVDEIYLKYLSKTSIFNILEYTPPQISIKNSEITNSSGAIQYASEENISYDFNCTFLDNNNSDYYIFLKIWFDYIFELLLGSIKPNPEFLNSNSPTYGAMDYVANFYILKYDPTMKDLYFVGKVFAAFPKTLPTKEFLGTRSTNDITLLATDFVCSYYSESFDKTSSLFAEVNSLLLNYSI